MPDKPNMGLLGIIPDEATRSLLSFFCREKSLTGDPLCDAAIHHALMVATTQHMPYGNAWLGTKIPPEQAAVNDRIAPDANSLLQMLMQHIKRNEMGPYRRPGAWCRILKGKCQLAYSIL